MFNRKHAWIPETNIKYDECPEIEKVTWKKKLEKLYYFYMLFDNHRALVDFNWKSYYFWTKTCSFKILCVLHVSVQFSSFIIVNLLMNYEGLKSIDVITSKLFFLNSHLLEHNGTLNKFFYNLASWIRSRKNMRTHGSGSKG